MLKEGAVNVTLAFPLPAVAVPMVGAVAGPLVPPADDPMIGMGVLYLNLPAVILSHFSCYYIFVNKDERTPYVTY